MATRLVTGLSAAQERVTLTRLQLTHEVKMRAPIEREIARAMVEIGSQYDNPGRQAQAIQDHRTRLQETLTRLWVSTGQAFGDRIVKATSKSRTPDETKALFDQYAKIFTDWIHTWGAQRITQIAGTTEAQVAAIVNPIVAESVTEGVGQGVLGRRIKDAMQTEGGVLSRARSRVIARTESHSAAQAGAQSAAKSTGFPMRKVWLSGAGERTREDHAAADGQTVALDEPFTVGGESLMYPGDPAGSAEQVINCRCQQGFSVSIFNDD